MASHPAAGWPNAGQPCPATQSRWSPRRQLAGAASTPATCGRHRRRRRPLCALMSQTSRSGGEASQSSTHSHGVTALTCPCHLAHPVHPAPKAQLGPSPGWPPGPPACRASACGTRCPHCGVWNWPSALWLGCPSYVLGSWEAASQGHGPIQVGSALTPSPRVQSGPRPGPRVVGRCLPPRVGLLSSAWCLLSGGLLSAGWGRFGGSLAQGRASLMAPVHVSLCCRVPGPAQLGKTNWCVWLVIGAHAGEAQAQSKDYPGQQERAQSLLGVRASREQGILSIPLDGEAGFPPFSLVPI